MNAYIINLERSTERKKYMEEIMHGIPEINYQYVPAVDGKKLSKTERKERWNDAKSIKIYTRPITNEEVGCALSHQKCYQKLLEEDLHYALILEDDILIPDIEKLRKLIPLIENYMEKCMEPCILLLSGFYWWTTSSPITTEYRIANTYQAYLAHSYIVNRLAAKCLQNGEPFLIADDWLRIRQKGIKCRALLPHLIDQKGEKAFVSNIDHTLQKLQYSLRWQFRNMPQSIIQIGLHILQHYEKETL